MSFNPLAFYVGYNLTNDFVKCQKGSKGDLKPPEKNLK